MSTSTENNKRLAIGLFDRLSAGDVEGALALMTDDVTWQIAGKPELTRSAGTYDKRRLRKLFQRMWSQLENGLAMKVLGTIAEDDRVAVEAESAGDLKNGRAYRQQYHFLFVVRDGKIAALREYLDTQHAHHVWERE